MIYAVTLGKDSFLVILVIRKPLNKTIEMQMIVLESDVSVSKGIMITTFQ